MDIISEMHKEFHLNADPKHKAGTENFFREPRKVYGVKSDILKQIYAKYYKEAKKLPKKEFFELCEKLLKINYGEDSHAVFSWCRRLSKTFVKEDFYVFEHWVLNYVTDWAMCDDFVTHPVADLTVRYPELVERTVAWRKSPNRWARRASAVIFIWSVRKGHFFKDVLEMATTLLEDKDDMVQKGYGWALKDASIKYMKEVYDFVMKHKARMPRTALRYAIERFPEKMRQECMNK